MKLYFAIALITLGMFATDQGQLEAQGRGRGNQTPTIRQLVWVDRSGDVEGNIGPRMSSILDPSISPDGSKVAVRGRQEQGETDHLYILEGSSADRLTTNEGFERHMIWSPDGSRIAYSIQNQGGVSNLYIRASDGSGGDRPLIESEGMHKWYPSWTPDASTVVFHTNDPETEARDLWYVSVASGETGVLVDDDGIQALARLSRDGRFVAYQSDQDGQTEIYVTTFPRSDARWKVSTNGGTWPKWSDDELFYWEGNSLMAVEFGVDDGFSSSTPRRLFTGEQVGMGANNMMTSYNPEYDVSADGSRFVVTQRLERENQAAPQPGSQAAVVKGGDDRTGEYQAVEDWWKPAPDHEGPWTWGEVSGVAVDNPDRIIVAIWGDRNAQGQGREGGSNYLVVVDRNGNIRENWSQWDSIFNKPHQVYISPYDPERHVWVVERGGGRGVNMQILKFTNDGSELVMRLVDPNHPTSRAEARANPNPGPFTYGDPAVLAFLPDGSFFLGDGYWNSRIVKYNADGEYVMEWGELGSGPGQFDLVHGLAVDRDHRVYVGDRTNNRIQIFTEDGEFIEEWPDISDPVGVFIDETDGVWVISARLNRILKYGLDGELQYYWGAFGGTRGGFAGGLSRPHQLDVDQDGNVYIASWDGGWMNKFVPRPGADPFKLIGRPLVLAN